MRIWNICWLQAAGGLSLALACSASPDAPSQDLGSGGAVTPNSGGGQPSGGADGSGGASTGGANSSGGQPGGGANSSGGQPSGGADSSGGTSPEAGASGGPGVGGAVLMPPTLGMNDVTILAPLPESVDQPVVLKGSDLVADGTPLLPQALFERLTRTSSTPILEPAMYDRLQVVAVRFDLCDHNAPGPCPSSGDGRLRLVLQPLSDQIGAHDVGFHAFYSIAEEEIPAALQTLGELSELRIGPAEPLAPSPTLASGNGEYTEKLRGFVREFGGENRLVRLTMNAQPSIAAAITWTFRGVERQDAEFKDMQIVGTTETTQQVLFAGDAFYAVEPVSDKPPGLALALDLLEFNATSRAEHLSSLEALVAIDNPLANGPETVACVACHTSTVALATRATDIGVDPMALPGRYVTPYDVTIDGGKSATTPQTLRALGWLGKAPMISQRVANDTALVLEDIGRR